MLVDDGLNWIKPKNKYHILINNPIVYSINQDIKCPNIEKAINLQERKLSGGGDIQKRHLNANI